MGACMNRPGSCGQRHDVDGEAWCGCTVAFCASLAWVLVRAGLVPAVSDMTWTVWQTRRNSQAALSLLSSPLTQLCPQFYRSNVVPIAALFAAVLWCAARLLLRLLTTCLLAALLTQCCAKDRVGNAAYMFISIAFIQMLKALMVVAVYGFGVALGTEVLTGKRLANVSVISLGVVIASYGGAQCWAAPFWGSGSCACPGPHQCWQS